MSENGKSFIRYDVAKFVVYIVTLAISVMLFYGAIDKRVTIVETKLEQKVDLNQVMDRLDKLESKIESKIENEVKKLNRN